MTILIKLAQGGHEVSKTKLQYCQPQVEHLGRLIAHQTKAIAPAQLEGIIKAPLPQIVGKIMTFMGMMGFSSDWIEDYSIQTAPLRALVNSRAPLIWNSDALVAFESLKKELQVATALATPDYIKLFQMYVANKADGYASAVVMQDTCIGRKKQAIAYYCTKLDSVAQGYPLGYQQGLAALHYTYEKASTLTMVYPIVIYTHHKVVESGLQPDLGSTPILEADVNYFVDR